MGILVNTGFNVGSSNPIDSRTVKNTTNERDELVTDGLVYENLKVYCKDTQTEYRWTGTEWEEVGSGGGSGSGTASDVAYDNTALADVDNVAEALDTIISEVDELFQSVSDGKTLVANAITDKGVSTSATETFATMTTNIGAIPYLALKTETKSVSRTGSGAGYQTLTLYFSNTVYGIASITASSATMLPDTNNKSLATISGNSVILRRTDGGPYTVTAYVKK